MCKVAVNLTAIIILVKLVMLASFANDCNGQALRLEFSGIMQIPSTNCSQDTPRFMLDTEARKLCFCVRLPSSLPSWICMKADRRITMDYLARLKNLIEDLRKEKERKKPPAEGQSLSPLNFLNTDMMESFGIGWWGWNKDNREKGGDTGKSKGVSKSSSKSEPQSQQTFPFIPFFNV